MFEFWTNLTDGQATLLNGLLTLLAAIFAVVFGARMFDGKVTSLKDAIAQSSKDVEDHIKTLNEAMNEIEASALVTSERVAEISGREGLAVPAAEIVSTNLDPQHPDTDYIGRVQSAWEAIRDHIEAQASDTRIDGRRRAKYARLDRRSYGSLVAAMAQDGEIRGSRDLAMEWERAIELRHSFRNGKRRPTEAEAKEMERIASLGPSKNT